MKILITGASGFLGSWICRVLESEFDLVGLVRSSSNLYKISDLTTSKITRAEFRDWSKCIIDFKPDVLILNHWDGVSNLDKNNPNQFLNIERIKVLAEAAIDSGVKTIIGVGSQAELGPLQCKISEDQIDAPTTLYGRAKVDTRLLLENLTEKANINFVWMRVFSTYGPLDDGPWLIPSMVDSLTRDHTFEMTHGEQQWSYLHAYDLAQAFLAVIRGSRFDGIVNVGNPESISIRQVAMTIGEHLNKEDLISFGAKDYQINEVMKLQPICNKLALAGWKPRISFSQGLIQTMDWLQRKDLSELKTVDGISINFRIPLRP